MKPIQGVMYNLVKVTIRQDGAAMLHSFVLDGLSIMILTIEDFNISPRAVVMNAIAMVNMVIGQHGRFIDVKEIGV